MNRSTTVLQAATLLVLLLTACGGPAGTLPAGENRPPAAQLRATPAEGQAPLTVDLDASQSSDPDGIIVSYTWKVAHITESGQITSLVSFTGSHRTHELAEGGTYKIVLMVTDNDGATASASTSIIVEESTNPPTPPAPAPNAQGPDPSSLTIYARTGDTALGTFTLKNTGTTDLTITKSTSSDWLGISPEEDTLPPGALRQFTVNAACGSTAETRQGSLTFTTNDPDEPTITIPVTLQCTTASTSDFQIDLIFGGDGLDASRRQVFERAAQRWAEVITGDLPDMSVSDSWVKAYCGDEFSYSGTVDDILIFAKIEAIDGPYGVLGQAGACIDRSAVQGGYPAVGVMIFDSADIAMMESSGMLTGTILHEMGHVIGLNAYAWDRLGYLSYNGPDCLHSDSVLFAGANGVREWSTLGGSGNVPVEDNGQPGTACSHWDEETFGNELMTGYASPEMPLSRLTVGALDDLGYAVEYSAADTYSRPALPALQTQSTFHLQEVILPPRGIILPDGSTTPLQEREPRTLDFEVPAGR
ncbi:MAG TPA: leishmanolysin-related zinc metalloendopeptidase [Trueperaceae bacterium]